MLLHFDIIFRFFFIQKFTFKLFDDLFLYSMLYSQNLFHPDKMFDLFQIVVGVR